MEKKGNIKGLIPLFIFLGLYAGAGIFTRNFGSMPLLTAFMITMGVSFALNKSGDKKLLMKKLRCSVKELEILH